MHEAQTPSLHTIDCAHGCTCARSPLPLAGSAAAVPPPRPAGRRLALYECFVEPSAYTPGAALTLSVRFQLTTVQLKPGAVIKIAVSTPLITAGAITIPAGSNKWTEPDGTVVAGGAWTVGYAGTTAGAQQVITITPAAATLPTYSVVQFQLAGLTNPAVAGTTVTVDYIQTWFGATLTNWADPEHIARSWTVLAAPGVPVIAGWDTDPIIYVYYWGRSEERREHPEAPPSQPVTSTAHIKQAIAVTSAQVTVASVSGTAALGTLSYEDRPELDSITGVYNDATGVLSLTGADSAYRYTRALLRVRYTCPGGLTIWDTPYNHVQRLAVSVVSAAGTSAVAQRDVKVTTAVRVYTDAYPGVIAM
jgi:hypothetical protein